MLQLKLKKANKLFDSNLTGEAKTAFKRTLNCYANSIMQFTIYVKKKYS